MNKISRLVVMLGVMLVAGCAYYATPPATTSTYSSVSKFDQSWSAAIGAFTDQGVRITSEDRGAGVIQGTRNGIQVTGNISRQANGGVRVQFDTSGDKGLIDGITRSYNGRMGR